MRTFLKLSTVTFVFLAGFAFTTPAEAATPTDWPTWIGRVENSTHSNVVHVVDMSDYQNMPEAQVVEIPVHFQPLHYEQLANVRYMKFPDELVQTGASTDEWPTWIGAPGWMY